MRERDQVSRNGLSPWPIRKDCVGDQAHGGKIKGLGDWISETKSGGLFLSIQKRSL